MSVPNLPGQRHPIAGNLQCTPEFYRVLQQIAEYVRVQQASGEASSTDVAALQDQTTRLFATLGPLISTNGTGIVTRNGAQFAFVDPADSTNVTLTLDYSANTLTADLTDLADTGAGALLAITRDGKGRVTGTRSATITGTAGNVTVTNGNASAGLPTIDLADVANSGAGSLLAITRDTKGRVTGTKAATITGTAGNITVTNGDASSGLPTIDLANVTPTAGGTLKKVAFDTKGRRSQESSATTDDLSEGTTNLYFTSARVRSTTLTGLSTATATPITSADTVLSADGKLQAQISLVLNDLIVSSSGKPLVTSAGDFITTSAA
ncbi:hypothetical protein ACO2Q2_16545 [Dyella sp. KRB-257]|uniref:hypothetical protein n=1 Tax=Dyella sp. KRB-257 TaxID=3400915 RepID=UPI003C0B2FF2